MVHEQTVQHLLADAEIFEYDLDSELEILTQFDEFVACDDVVWDVGAHSGLYGIFLSLVSTRKVRFIFSNRRKPS